MTRLAGQIPVEYVEDLVDRVKRGHLLEEIEPVVASRGVGEVSNRSSSPLEY